MVTTSNSGTKSVAKTNNRNGKRGPNIRTNERELNNILTHIKPRKAVTLLNKLLLKYTTIVKEQKAQSILDKATKQISDLYGD
jgi:uncharacterized protein YifE (UPF0438 family)